MSTLTSIPLKLSTYPQKEQEELLTALGDIVFRGTLLRLIEEMSNTARTEFAVLLADNAPPEALEAFIKEQVPGADAAVTETLTALASDISKVGV